MQYRKKPVIIDAWLFDGSWESAKIIVNQANGLEWSDSGIIEIQTLEGEMVASKGDWIIKGVKGEFYPCKPEIFKMTYEEVI